MNRSDEWCFHCDEERVIGLFCSGEFNGEPCGGVWLNLLDREKCPRCGFDSLDYLRVDDDLKCREHREQVDEDLEYCIRTLEPMFNKHGYKLVRCSVPETPRCPVGGIHMAKATEDACPACGPLGDTEGSAPVAAVPPKEDAQ